MAPTSRPRATRTKEEVVARRLRSLLRQERVRGGVGPLGHLLAWLAEGDPDAVAPELVADEVAAHAGLAHEHVIAAMRELASAGAGRFLCGRRGLRSRLRPSLGLARLAREARLGAVAPALVRHAYRLRPDLIVELTLPRDLAVAEASRLAAVIRTLPFASRRDGGEPVVIGMSRLRISMPVMLAVQEGLFRREGLLVELRTFETAQPMMDAIAAGHLAAGGFVAFPISMAAEIARRVALRHAAVLLEDRDHPISRFLVRKRAGIRALSDLPGRRVGILPTLAYRAWIELMLRESGVDPSSVDMRDLTPAATAAAISSGTVDALFTNDPAASLALAAGAAIPLDPEPRVERAVLDPLPFGSFVITAAFAEANPAAARALVRGVDAAIDLAARNPARARAALAAHLPNAEVSVVRRFTPARFGKTGMVGAETLARLGSRYHELGILRRPLAPVPFA